MPVEYQVDYELDGKQFVRPFDVRRKAAMAYARKISNGDAGVAYVVTSEDNQAIGHLAYASGALIEREGCEE